MNEAQITLGLPVTYYSVILADGTKLNPLQTKIRSEVWTVSGGERIVKVDGIAGGVSIKHLEPIIPNPSCYVINTLDEWRHEVSKCQNADDLNAKLKFLYSYQTYHGRHPFRDNELDHARNILYKHARSLPVNKYSAGWRDQQAPLMAKPTQST